MSVCTINAAPTVKHVPEDTALPQLAAALDPAFMLKLLPLPASATTNHGCRVAYVRYKPGTNCIVLYEVLQPAGPPVWAYAKLYARRSAPPQPDRRLWKYDPQHRMALMLFPFDQVMDGLRRVATQETTTRVLERVIPASKRNRFAPYWGNWTPVRYKPERRCILRGEYEDVDKGNPISGLRGFFARFYGAPHAEKLAFRHRHFSRLAVEAVDVPACLGYSERDRVVLLKEIHGKPLGKLFDRSSEELGSALDRVAESLVFWHRLPAPPGTPDLGCGVEQLSPAAQALEALLPNADVSPAELARRLLKTAPACERPALLHGDFYYDQILLRSTGPARFLDLDELGLGDPLFDVANFCAHAELLQVTGELESSRGDWIRRRFVETYQRASRQRVHPGLLGWYRSASLLKLAVLPFRRQAPDWPCRAQELLARADRVLSEESC